MDQHQLALTLDVLQTSLSANTSTQQMVQQTLAEYNLDPQFNRYLLFVLTSLRQPQCADETRSMAGIVLKNNIRNMYQAIPEDILNDVRVACLHCLGEASELIRASISIIITTIAQCGGLATWPTLLPTLLEQISNPDMNIALVKYLL